MIRQKKFIEKYLSNFSINFKIEKYGEITVEDKFLAVQKLLNQIESDIKQNLTEYVGTDEFIAHKISGHKLTQDKKIKINKKNQRIDGQTEFLEDKDWYVFNANYGTSEEKSFVEMIDRQVSELKKDFDKIYLIRNERQLKIYNFKDGRAFEPDYLMFLVDKRGKGVTYQLFLEPKGLQLAGNEKWKSEFLEEIKEKFQDRILEFSKSQKYKIIGLPFYNQEMENDFKDKLFKGIGLNI